MRKSLEEKIRSVIVSHEKQTKEIITEVRAIRKREIGFGKSQEIKVNYWTE